MPRKEVIAPGATAIGPYAHAIDSGELLFLSGQTPIDPTTGALVSGGVAEQTAQCFANLFAVLQHAGLTSDDVQKVNVYLTDMENFAAMNEVYRTMFTAPYPARTTVAVAALPMNAMVEIELVAKKPIRS